MNKREAVAVQALLDWVLALVAWEVDPDRTDLPDEELVRIVGVLADRSSTALGAGIRQGDAIAAGMRMVGGRRRRAGGDAAHRPGRPGPGAAGGRHRTIVLGRGAPAGRRRPQRGQRDVSADLTTPSRGGRRRRDGRAVSRVRWRWPVAVFVAGLVGLWAGVLWAVVSR